MKKVNKLVSLALALVMCLTLAVPAFAMEVAYYGANGLAVNVANVQEAVIPENVMAERSIAVPKSATLAVIDGKQVYSNFADANGKEYAYYCPEDGSYFRWINAERALPDGTLIRNFEFRFSDSMTGDYKFQIPYASGRVSVNSQLYDYTLGRKNFELKYSFNMELKEEVVGLDTTVFSRNFTTNSGAVSKTFSCTKGGTFYFVLSAVGSLPYGYQFDGSGSVYGYN